MELTATNLVAEGDATLQTVIKPPDAHLVSLPDVCDVEQYEYKRDGSVILCMLLHLTNHRTDKGNTNTYRKGNNSSSRFQPVKSTFDRIAFFGDYMSPGKVFVMFLKTPHASKLFFKHVRPTKPAIGKLYALIEPEACVGYMTSKALHADPIPILENAICIPVKNQVSMPDTLLQAPLRGQERYFSKHNCKEVIITGVSVTQASCGGAFCDRQHPYDPSGTCPCFRTDRMGNVVVLEMNVWVPKDKLEARSPGHANIIVHGFRSLITTSLFIEPRRLARLNSLQIHRNAEIRKAVNAIVDYVNSKHGWTYVGWIKAGAVRDQAQGDNQQPHDDVEDLVSDNHKPHLVYLFPSDKTDEDYIRKNLQARLEEQIEDAEDNVEVPALETVNNNDASLNINT